MVTARGWMLGVLLLGGAAWLAPSPVTPAAQAASAEARSNSKSKKAQAPAKAQPKADDDDEDEVRPKRKPTLLPAAKRRQRYSVPPSLQREEPGDGAPRTRRSQRYEVAPLPPARDPPGDRGPPLGVPPQYDPRWVPATPPIGTPPLPPARQVPGESGVPLGPGPLSPVR